MFENVKKIREEQHISKSELSLKAGISRTTLWRIEKGEDNITLSTKTLKSLSKALNCKIEDLI